MNKKLNLTKILSFYLFRGVVAVDIDLKNLDINQCSEKGLFSSTHKCSMETTQVRHHGFSDLSKNRFLRKTAKGISHSCGNFKILGIQPTKVRPADSMHFGAQSSWHEIDYFNASCLIVG
jgi:hypothetical protein